MLAVLALIGAPAAAQVGGIPEIARGTETGFINVASLNAGPASVFSGTAGAGVPPGFGTGFGGGFSVFGPSGMFGPYDIFGPMGLFGYQNGGLFGPGAILFPNLMISGWWNGVC
ncbi:MAG TPA: hypothetical protein VLT35_02195 [Methanocella sp.]|nr:hypothetical protein [Methanocella sp.]